MEFLKNIPSFWCIILAIFIAMVIHYLLSNGNIIEGQENLCEGLEECCDLNEDGTCVPGTESEDCPACIYDSWISKECFNTCKCGNHTHTPPEVIGKQFAINEDGNYRSDETVGYENATHFKCYSENHLVGLSTQRALDLGVDRGELEEIIDDTDLNGGVKRNLIRILIIDKLENDIREAQAQAQAALDAATAAEAERLAQELQDQLDAEESARVIEEARLQSLEQQRAREEAAAIAAAEEAAAEEERLRLLQEQEAEEERLAIEQSTILLSHSEAGMCSGSSDYAYYGNREGVAQENSTGDAGGQSPGKGYYQTSVGTCAVKRSCNFCCGITAEGVDGNIRNYGPHCREGQCGGGPFPSKHEENGTDQKTQWTDC